MKWRNSDNLRLPLCSSANSGKLLTMPILIIVLIVGFAYLGYKIMTVTEAVAQLTTEVDNLVAVVNGVLPDLAAIADNAEAVTKLTAATDALKVASEALKAADPDTTN